MRFLHMKNKAFAHWGLPLVFILAIYGIWLMYQRYEQTCAVRSNHSRIVLRSPIFDKYENDDGSQLREVLLEAHEINRIINFLLSTESKRIDRKTIEPLTTTMEFTVIVDDVEIINCVADKYFFINKFSFIIVSNGSFTDGFLSDLISRTGARKRKFPFGFRSSAQNPEDADENERLQKIFDSN